MSEQAQSGAASTPAGDGEFSAALSAFASSPDPKDDASTTDALSAFVEAGDGPLDTVDGDDAGDSVADEAKTEEAKPEAKPVPSSMDDIKAFIAERTGQKPQAQAEAQPEAKADPKPEPKPEAQAKAEAKETAAEIVEELESILEEQFGDAAPRIAKSLQSRMEKIVLGKISELEAAITPYLKVVETVHSERVSSDADRIVDSVLEELTGQEPGVGDFYGASRSAASKEQNELRASFKKAANFLAETGAYKPEDRARLISHAHAMVMDDYRKAQAQKQGKQGDKKPAGVQINRQPANQKAEAKKPSNLASVNRDRKVKSLLDQLNGE